MLKEWINKAEDDLLAARMLMEHEEFPVSVVCFHCQQSAEKYFKAYLTFREVEFPKIHDMIAILENYLIPLDITFSDIKQQTVLLTDYAVKPRYPDFLIELTVNDACEAYTALMDIKNFIISKLSLS